MPSYSIRALRSAQAREVLARHTAQTLLALAILATRVQ